MTLGDAARIWIECGFAGAILVILCGMREGTMTTTDALATLPLGALLGPLWLLLGGAMAVTTLAMRFMPRSPPPSDGGPDAPG